MFSQLSEMESSITQVLNLGLEQPRLPDLYFPDNCPQTPTHMSIFSQLNMKKNHSKALISAIIQTKADIAAHPVKKATG